MNVGCTHSDVSRENLFPCLFQPLKATRVPWFVVSFLPSNTVAPCLQICVLPPFYKDLCDDTKPLGHLTISRSLTQSHLQSPFYHVKCTAIASGGQDVVGHLWDGYSGFHMVRWEDMSAGRSRVRNSCLHCSPRPFPTPRGFLYKKMLKS